ncbi:MAG: RNA-binding S4 domain-containing protein [Eubacteriales bacterium]|nr:RNA-binding S4 domain-containing protein [Eubacteriales bacterium]
MRVDKFLKVSRIIKRRTVAREAGDQGRVLLNGKAVKPSAEVNPGDILQVEFGNHISRYRVLKVEATTTRQGAQELVEELQDV